MPTPISLPTNEGTTSPPHHFMHQRRPGPELRYLLTKDNGKTCLRRVAAGPSGVEKDVGDNRGAHGVGAGIGKVDASYAKSGAHAEQVSARKQRALADRAQVIHLQLHCAD